MSRVFHLTYVYKLTVSTTERFRSSILPLMLILGFLFGLFPIIKDSVVFSKFLQNSSVPQNISVIYQNKS